MNLESLLHSAFADYEKALELLQSEDYYDAAEKAWNAIETLRKAFLVALGVPYDKAKTVNYGLPLFSRLMRALGLRKLLRKYEWFDYKLHIMGFYERITSEEEIKEIIEKHIDPWLREMHQVIMKIRGAKIGNILEIYDQMIRLKQEVLKKSGELARIRSELAKRINTFASSLRAILQG